VTPAEVREWTERSRAASGLPLKIQDPTVLAAWSHWRSPVRKSRGRPMGPPNHDDGRQLTPPAPATTPTTTQAPKVKATIADSGVAVAVDRLTAARCAG
jgi:hypothetical protein